MRILTECTHPNVLAIAAAVAHVEICERLRSLDVCSCARATLATAILGGLFSMSGVHLSHRWPPRWQT